MESQALSQRPYYSTLACTRGPPTKIMQTMVCGIPLVLGLRIALESECSILVLMWSSGAPYSTNYASRPRWRHRRRMQTHAPGTPTAGPGIRLKVRLYAVGRFFSRACSGKNGMATTYMACVKFVGIRLKLLDSFGGFTLGLHAINLRHQEWEKSILGPGNIFVTIRT